MSHVLVNSAYTHIYISIMVISIRRGGYFEILEPRFELDALDVTEPEQRGRRFVVRYPSLSNFRSPGPGERGDPFGFACFAGLLVDGDRVIVKGFYKCFPGTSSDEAIKMYMIILILTLFACYAFRSLGPSLATSLNRLQYNSSS